MKLLPALRALGREVMELTDGTINCGGCGVYAAAVATRLQAMGLPVEVIVPRVYANVKSVEEARNNLREAGNGNTARDWCAGGLSFYHVGVRFKHEGRWYTHDTEVTRGGRMACGDDLVFAAMDDGLTVEEAQGIADDARGWNSTFDRDLIPEVRDLVEGYLS